MVGSVTGEALVGLSYTPLFSYFEEEAEAHGAFRVLAGDFVDTTDGTGIVHIAPGHGEDDQRLGTEAGLEMISPVDEKGRYTSEVTDWAGINVLEANPLITTALKERGVVLRQETYDHNYPHCWRTDTPIIYRAVSSWFVEVTAFRDRLVELNQEINWIPGHVRDGQFGQWLEGAAIGRSPATGSGAHRSRFGAATTLRTPASTCTDRSTTSRPTSGCAPKTCIDPGSTNWFVPTRTTPPERR